MLVFLCNCLFSRFLFLCLPRTGQSRGEGGRDPLHSAPSPREEPPDAGASYETLGQVSFGADAPFLLRYKSSKAKEDFHCKNHNPADGNKGLNFPFVFAQLKRANCFPSPVLFPVLCSVFFCASLI